MDAKILQVAKIKVRVGTMELEYEGDPSFLTGGIEALLVTMGDLAGKVPDITMTSLHSQSIPASGGNSSPKPTGTFTFSTSTIAAHLEAKTGPELAICAMAQLELVQGKTTSLRADILAQMKSATSYYNENMSSNLSAILVGLTKAKRINEISKNTFALNANERKQIEAKVAEIG
jgi:hypothetical protein